MNFDFPLILVLLTAVTGGIWLIDSVFFASKRNEIALGERVEPVLVEYSRSFFPVILVVLVLRSFLVEPFRIPSGSMMPTLLVGDFILVNKFAYGIRIPVLNKKIIEVGSPERGDVIVFRYPQDPRVDYIKRVVGLPGDTIFYRGKILMVNGQPATQTAVGRYVGVGTGSNMTGALENIEDLTSVEHKILIIPGRPDFIPGCDVLAKGPIVVPEGHFFMMGDNRDNSNDGRCWGFVPEENLAGRAFAIWMSWDSNLSSSPPISWERVGTGIK